MSKKLLTDKGGEVRALGKSDFKKMRPVSEMMPNLVAAQKAGRLKTRPAGRPPVDSPKQKTTIRFSEEVTEYFRSTGKGWQTRVDQVLLKYVRKQRTG